MSTLDAHNSDEFIRTFGVAKPVVLAYCSGLFVYGTKAQKVSLAVLPN